VPLPLTVSCFSKIQIGFTFLVPAHPGSPGKRAVKRVCVCVHTTMSRPFYSDAIWQKMCRSSSSLSQFLFPHDFSGTIADTNIINTPSELFRPTGVPFVGYKTKSKDLGGVFGCKIDFCL